jgi:hypothetical protein
MPTDIIIATDKPKYQSSGLVAATSGSAYTAISPTTTTPTTSGQNFLVPSNLGDKPSLFRVMPFSSVNNATAVGMRVVGWTSASVPVEYTNLLTYSQEFDNAAWLKTNLAVTGGSINAVTAPDGTLTADNALETGATVNHYIGRDTGSPGTATTIRTFSVFVKGGLGRDHVSVCAGNGSGGPYYTITVNLNTGAVTQADLVNTGTWFTTTPSNTVTSVGNGWYRITITSRLTQYYLISPQSTATPTSGSNWGLGSYASDVTKGVSLWGAQLENGSTVSPYAATTTAAVIAVNNTVPQVQMWLPTIIGEFDLTYSTGTVPNATTGGNNYYLFSSASQVGISPDASMYRPAVSTATRTEPASVMVDPVGSQLIQLQFKADSGTMGAYWYMI